MNYPRPSALAFALAMSTCLPLAACGGTTTTPDQTGGTCTLTAATTTTAKVNGSGCHVLTRDASACTAMRQSQGLSGYWLKFSCRVSLSMSGQGSGQTVQATSDGQPDYKSMYFPTDNPCYEAQPGGVHNPNSIAAKNYTVNFPLAPNMTSQPMMGTAVVGLAVNGVPIYGNFAAPGDDIFLEAVSFDSCGAHPQMQGNYHYHGEPYSITNDDSNFVGVMRDGYPIYGRRDADGSMPMLDSFGGHTGVTVDSPATAVYHYHINLQTSTSSRSAGQMQWFLTTGMFRGTPAACSTCR